MRLSRYCKIYQDKKDKDSVMLFSTLKASKISVPKSMLEDIETGSLSSEEKSALTRLGVFVKSREYEKKKMLGFMDGLNTINKTFRAIVVMDLDCNLACKYCFEGTRKGRHYMSEETADEFVEFVKEKIQPTPAPLPRGDFKKKLTSPAPSLVRRRISRPLYKGTCLPDRQGRRRGSGFDSVSLTFYGGEPLLNKELIIHISEKLKAFCDSNKKIFNISFITNGTLLTAAFVEKIKPYGLKSASITLDGPKPVHDAFRPFRTGRGSFDRILKNLKAVCGMMDIQIGGNFTKDNYRQFPLLLDYLAGSGLSPDRISQVRFDPVLNESEGIALPDFREGCISINEPWLFEASLFLREEILKRGFRLEKTAPGVCMMEYKNNILVNYNGDIYKCPGLIGRKEFRIGNIKTGIKDYSKSHNLDNWKNEECLECEYLPLCFGGCRYMKLVRDGNMDGVDCKKPYLDTALERLVEQDIRYNSGLTVR